MTCQGLGISPRLGQYAPHPRTHDEDHRSAFRVAKSHSYLQGAPGTDQNILGARGSQLEPVSGRQSHQKRNYLLPARLTPRSVAQLRAARCQRTVDKPPA